MKMLRIRSTMAIFAAVAALFAAMSASAALLATNDFEEAAVADLTDFTAEGDEALSDIIGITAYDSDKPSGAYTTEPWPYAAANFGSQYLSVDSGTNMVWRLFADSSSKMYFDSYVKFTPTSGDVEYPDASKFVIFLDAATSNLCVISGTDENTTTPVTNRLNATVLPESWGRITVCATASDGVFAFQVRLNGALLATAGSTSTFYSLAAGSTVSQVGFKGTGAVDDMVVRTSDPFGTAASINGETFATLEQAAAEAEDGDVIALLSDSSESVSLPVGVSLNKNGHNYSGTVTASAGNGYEVVVSGDSYTIVDNRASTWTDAGSDHSWSTVDNWSTHCVPSQYTVVTLPDGAAIEATGTALLPVSNIVVNGAASLTCAGDLGNNWPSIGIKGDISGSGTLTLARFGLKSSDGDAVTVGCNIYFDGKGYDSFIENGSFVFDGSVTGTNKLVLLATTTFNGAVSVPDGAILSIGRAGTSPVATDVTFGSSATLAGDGTVFIYSDGSDATTAFSGIKSKLQIEGSWNGVCELAGTMNKIDFTLFGNAGSTVRANGLTGYLNYSATHGKIAKVEVVEIGSQGLTLNNRLSNNSFIFSAALTGSGPLVIGTSCNNNNYPCYYFAGDASDYTGALTVTNLHSSTDYAPTVVFTANRDVTADAASTKQRGAVVVETGAEVTVGAQWWANGGYVVNGEMSFTSAGSLVAADAGYVTGAGTLKYAAVPQSFNTDKVLNASWTGTVEFSGVASGTFNPNAYVRTNSKIRFNGFTVPTLGGTGTTYAMGVELVGEGLTLDGDYTRTYTFSGAISGGGSLNVTRMGSGGSYVYFTGDFSGFTGSVNVASTTSRVVFGAGSTTNGGGSITVANGTEMTIPDSSSWSAKDLNVAGTLIANGPVTLTGNLYGNTNTGVYRANTNAAAVTVTSTWAGTYVVGYDSGREVKALFDFNKYGNSGSTVDVAGLINGWPELAAKVAPTIKVSGFLNLSDGSTQIRVEFNKVTGDGVITFTSDKDYTICCLENWNGIITNSVGCNYIYLTNVVSGAGTIVNYARPHADNANPRFGSAWTGTYIVNYDNSAVSDKFIIPAYGTVEINGVGGAFKGYPTTGSAAPAVNGRVVLNANWTIGYGLTDQTTAFASISGSGDLMLNGDGDGGTIPYVITKLDGYGGTLGGDRGGFTIGTVNVATLPAVETRVVKIQKGANGAIAGDMNLTVADVSSGSLVYDTLEDGEGLYRAVAQVGESKFATYAKAFANVGSAETVIKLVDTGYPAPEGWAIDPETGNYVKQAKKPASVMIFF